MITQSLRGIVVNWTTDTIRATFLYDGIVGDYEREIVSDVEAEIMAGFPNHDVEIETERHDSPAELDTRTGMAWVYKRKE